MGTDEKGNSCFFSFLWSAVPFPNITDSPTTDTGIDQALSDVNTMWDGSKIPD